MCTPPCSVSKTIDAATPGGAQFSIVALHTQVCQAKQQQLFAQTNTPRGFDCVRPLLARPLPRAAHGAARDRTKATPLLRTDFCGHGAITARLGHRGRRVFVCARAKRWEGKAWSHAELRTPHSQKTTTKDDPELEAIRQRRMAELMAQQGGGGGPVRARRDERRRRRRRPSDRLPLTLTRHNNNHLHPRL